MLKRNGVSSIIATVLIILITITAVSIVAAFIFPMVNNWLKGTSCYNYLDSVKIDESELTCFVPGEKVQATIEIGEQDVEEIAVSISIDGIANAYRIKNNSLADGVEMYAPSTMLTLPQKGGGKKTYVFINEKANIGQNVIVSAAAVSEGKVCDVTQNVQLKKCGA